VDDGSKIRMLILTPCERNIRRIGSLHSLNRAPVGEVIGVAVVLRSDSDGQGALDSEGSSKHHKLGVFSMAEPMIFSPSSFPHTSNKLLGGEKKEHRNVRTFENNCFLRNPDVAKCPFLFASFKKQPTRQVRVISENTDLLLLEGLDWDSSELTLVFLC
jgi:hypothetical protein